MGLRFAQRAAATCSNPSPFDCQGNIWELCQRLRRQLLRHDSVVDCDAHCPETRTARGEGESFRENHQSRGAHDQQRLSASVGNDFAGSPSPRQIGGGLHGCARGKPRCRCPRRSVHPPRLACPGVQKQLQETREVLLYCFATYFGTRNLVLHATVAALSTKLLQCIVRA
jgi:hypothetical protein